jgi:NAD(P)H dehydrogenase (quinone)
MTLIAAMLVRGMLIYSGGITAGSPFLHFGAVSTRAPDAELSRERCLHLGRLVARKAREIFSD